MFFLDCVQWPLLSAGVASLKDAGHDSCRWTCTCCGPLTLDLLSHIPLFAMPRQKQPPSRDRNPKPYCRDDRVHKGSSRDRTLKDFSNVPRCKIPQSNAKNKSLWSTCKQCHVIFDPSSNTYLSCKIVHEERVLFVGAGCERYACCLVEKVRRHLVVIQLPACSTHLFQGGDVTLSNVSLAKPYCYVGKHIPHNHLDWPARCSALRCKFWSK